MGLFSLVHSSTLAPQTENGMKEPLYTGFGNVEEKIKNERLQNRIVLTWKHSPERTV